MIALRSLYTRNPLVPLWPSRPLLSGNEKANVLTKRGIQLLPANHNVLPFHDYFLSIRRSIRDSWQFRLDQCVADGNKLAQLNLPLVHGLLVPIGVAA